MPATAAEDTGALLPADTLLVVEGTSESNAETDRVVKRKRYAEYGAPPLYLLVGRQERSVPGPKARQEHVLSIVQASAGTPRRTTPGDRGQVIRNQPRRKRWKKKR